MRFTSSERRVRFNPIRHWLACGLATLAVWQTRADLAPALEQQALELSRTLIKPQLAHENQGIGAFAWSRIQAYDLTPRTEQTVKNLWQNKDFQGFVQKKGVELEKLDHRQSVSLVREYLKTATNLDATVTAWYTLISDLGAPWKDSLPAYRVVEKDRPGDFVPRLVMLFRPVETQVEAGQSLAVLKAAYARASTPQERALCLALTPTKAFELTKIDGSKPLLQELSHWLGALQKTQTAEQLPALPDLDFFRCCVAFAQQDFAEGARLAARSPCRSLEPLMLILASKPDEARKAIDRLRKDSTLSEDEQHGLDKAAAILDELEAPPKQSEGAAGNPPGAHSETPPARPLAVEPTNSTVP